MQTNNQQTNEDQINIIEILFSLLSQRLLIILSLIIFTFLGIIYNHYNPDVFTTSATVLITKDQSDPSSFLLNNENEFLYNKYVDREDHASVFKSCLLYTSDAADE